MYKHGSFFPFVNHTQNHSYTLCALFSFPFQWDDLLASFYYFSFCNLQPSGWCVLLRFTSFCVLHIIFLWVYNVHTLFSCRVQTLLGFLFLRISIRENWFYTFDKFVVLSPHDMLLLSACSMPCLLYRKIRKWRKNGKIHNFVACIL